MSKAVEQQDKPDRPKRKKIIWRGNHPTKELHRCVEGEKHPPQCNLSVEGVLFKTAKAAFEQGYDMAAHCRKRFKSRENT